MSLKIGVTESGDPCFDWSWIQKLNEQKVDGAIIITKGLAHNGMSDALLTVNKNLRVPIILHCTCTGWGGCVVEPGVPFWTDTMDSLKQLILNGFPAEHVVLRIDPIIPTPGGLKRLGEILDVLCTINGVRRVRVSVLDNYKHVQKRFQDYGLSPLYDGAWSAPVSMLNGVIGILRERPEFEYEACAEAKLCALSDGLIEARGCVSDKDLNLMNIAPESGMYMNPQSRAGCLCLSCKTELLSKSKYRVCSHGCMYCYWKRPSEY